MKTKPTFGDVLKSLRGDPRDGGVSRFKLAAATRDIHERTIVQIETGVQAPGVHSVRILKALARGLALTRGKHSEREYLLLLLDAALGE